MSGSGAAGILLRSQGSSVKGQRDFLDARLLEALCDPTHNGLQIWLDLLTYVHEPKLTAKELADWQAGAAWYWRNVWQRRDE